MTTKAPPNDTQSCLRREAVMALNHGQIADFRALVGQLDMAVPANVMWSISVATQCNLRGMTQVGDILGVRMVTNTARAG